MHTVDCPNRDKGICTIPDRTAVVVDGAVSVHSRQEIESALPQIDLNTANLRRIETPIDGGALIQGVEHVGNMAVATATLPQILENSEGKASIVVTCSCGHHFVVEAP
jgi:hypothetical protein